MKIVADEAKRRAARRRWATNSSWSTRSAASPYLQAGLSSMTNAGTHTELIQMSYADFERLVRPRIAALAIR